MSVNAQGKESGVDLVELIEKEISTARDERRPTSRQQLAEIVNERTGMPVPEALTLVDTYCDEKEPAIPYYLQDEFAIPWLKAVAVINVVIGVAFLWYGVKVLRTVPAKPGWPWFCIGTIFCGLGAFAWVQSLERFVERRRKRSQA
jgi:hypothetical protein